MDKIIVYTDGASKGNGNRGNEIANKLAEMEANNV